MAPHLWIISKNVIFCKKVLSLRKTYDILKNKTWYKYKKDYEKMNDNQELSVIFMDVIFYTNCQNFCEILDLSDWYYQRVSGRHRQLRFRRKCYLVCGKRYSPFEVYEREDYELHLEYSPDGGTQITHQALCQWNKSSSGDICSGQT